VTFAILDDAQSTTFLKIEVPFSICVSNKLVGSLPTCTRSPSLSWLLHLDYGLTCNQSFKQMFTSPSSIDLLLLFLRLFHIAQDIVVDAPNEFDLLQKLSCSILYATPFISLSNQSLQIVVCPQTRCAASKNHERRESSACLDSTSVSKQNLGQLLIPTICVGRRSGKHSYAMLDGLDHTLGHPIALRPLRCSALVLNCIVLTHHIELCSPLPPIISQYELRDTEPTDYVILQKPG